METMYSKGQWETVKIDKFEKSIMRKKPKASVGYNKIYLNESACALMKKENNELKFAKLLINEEKTLLGIAFYEEEDEETLRVKVRYKGIEITSKRHMETVFGEKGIQKKATEYEVEGKENMLILVI